jgi:hypothetical protein
MQEQHIKNKILWILGFVLLFAVLGYFREFFFVNLNVIMFMKFYENSPAMPVPAVMKAFEHFTYAQLYYGKYLFTLLWTGAFFAANYFTILRFTGNRFFIRLLFYSYAVLLLISFLSMVYAYFVKEQLASDEYTLSRWLMGVAQSPIICLILLASEKLYKTTTVNDSKGSQDI